MACRKAHTAHVLSYWHTSSTQYTVKCVDSATGAIVGMGMWDVYLTPSEYKKGDIGWLEGAERERAEALVKPFWTFRERLWTGERYVYCHLTAVHPKAQRRGVGKLLMEYGMRIAEQAGLPIYTEASQAAIALYERIGFQRLKQSIKHKADLLWTEDIKGDGKDHDVPLVVWVPEGKLELLPKCIELV
jgi:ribosomal protein S18 acetylase RimI-like enzyme